MSRARLLRHAAVGVFALTIPLCPGCRCWPDGGVDDPNYTEGMRQFLAGNSAAATLLLRDFVAEHPRSARAAEAHYALAAMALKRGDTPEAERRFRQCLRSAPSEQQAAGCAVGLARCRFQRGAYRECRAACLDILRDEPSTPRADEVLFLLAEASDRAGMGAEARRTYRRVAAEFPNSPFARDAQTRLGVAPATPPTAAGGTFHVQVAALASASKAAEHARLLRERGYPATVAPARTGGTTLHTVRVGPYASRTDALVMARRLKAEGFDVLIKP